MSIFDFRELMRQHPTPDNPHDGIMRDCTQFLNVAMTVHDTSLCELLLCLLTVTASDRLAENQAELAGLMFDTLSGHCAWLSKALADEVRRGQ